MDNSVVSFEDGNKKKKTFYLRGQRKAVQYDSSGSEADIESDEDLNEKSDLKIEGDEEISEESENSGNESTKPVPGAGWADVMAKILSRAPSVTTKSIVLAKSKAYEKAKEQERQENISRIQEREEKKKKIFMGRTKPSPLDRERERKLQRIATRGVVQLFNAVKQQQKLREEKMKEIGASEKKRIKVESSFTKGAFVDMLKGTKVKIGPKEDAKKAANAENKPSWSVLRDDFMMGASMKDWDMEEDTDAVQEGKMENADNVHLSSNSDSDE